MKTVRTDPQFMTDTFNRDALPVPIAEKSSGSLDELGAARVTMHDNWKLIADAHSALQGDNRLSELGRAERGLKQVAAVVPGVHGTVFAAIGYAQRMHGLLTENGAAALAKDAAGSAELFSEIRSTLRQMPQGQRFSAAVAELKNGEPRVAQAVLAAPDFCTGLGPQLREQLQATLQTFLQGENSDYQAAADIQTAIAIVEAGWQNFAMLTCGLLGAWYVQHGLSVDSKTAAMLGFDTSRPMAAAV